MEVADECSSVIEGKWSEIKSDELARHQRDIQGRQKIRIPRRK
jgi:hypothetical protein